MRLRVGYGWQIDLILGKSCLFGSISRFPRRPGAIQRVALLPGWRGAKTKSKAKLKELAQGALEAKEPYTPIANDVPQYPTVIQGARNNMLKFKNCVLLTRVGNFYEVAAPPLVWAPNVGLTAFDSCILSKRRSMLHF